MANTNQILYDLLEQAVYQNQTMQAKKLIEQGASLKLDRGINVLLRAAINNNNPDLVRYLLAKGSPLETNLAVDHEGGSYENVLTLALYAKGHSIELLTILLKAGADPNLSGQGERNIEQMPLLQANTNEERRLLLQYGADPNIFYTEPLLITAVSTANQELIELLIQSGAKFNIGKQGMVDSAILINKCKHEPDYKFVLDNAVDSKQQTITAFLRQAGAVTFKEWCQQNLATRSNL